MNNMKKKINFTTQGHRADIGEYIINRILPNLDVAAVGPFVFLDHLLPAKHSPDAPLKKANGSGAHPHRGIATLTYIINGEADHFDSNGNHARVNSGGAQWMKAGNGIIHDEALNVDPKTNDLLTHVMQFWINLPAKHKAEAPKYVPVQGEEVPLQKLPDNKGWVKVVVGEHEELVSKIPTYSKQFIYHIHLETGNQFSLATESELEYAAFLPLNKARINDAEYGKGDLIVFDRSDGEIEITNDTKEPIDIIVFGGEKYKESIVARGPFVMNSENEIRQAYNDYHEGKYGQIKYDG